MMQLSKHPSSPVLLANIHPSESFLTFFLQHSHFCELTCCIFSEITTGPKDLWKCIKRSRYIVSYHFCPSRDPGTSNYCI